MAVPGRQIFFQFRARCACEDIKKSCIRAVRATFSTQCVQARQSAEPLYVQSIGDQIGQGSEGLRQVNLTENKHSRRSECHELFFIKGGGK